MMIEPNEAWLADDSVPRVTLAGKAWPFPPLAIRQISKVLPLIAAVEGTVRRVVTSTAKFEELTEPFIRDMASIAFWGLDRGHNDPPPKAPQLTREAFDEWPVTPPELFAAYAVVRQQTGMFRAIAPGEEPPAGETTASPQTGPA